MPNELKQQINIREVLARIRSGADGDRFDLLIVIATGKDKGLIKRRTYRYGAPAQAIHTPRRQRQGKENPMALNERDHVDRGTLPLTCLTGGVPRYKTPKIALILGYNQFKVIH